MKKTRFIPLLALVIGLCQIASAADFAVYDTLLSLGKPDLTPFGLRSGWIQYPTGPNRLWPAGTTGLSQPNEAAVRDAARRMIASGYTGPVILDLEHWEDDIRYNTAAVVDATLTKMKNIMLWYKDELLLNGQDPQKHLLGFFAVPPLHDYWTKVFGSSTQMADWRMGNEYLAPLTQVSDALFPLLYTCHNDPQRWIKYAQVTIAEARRIAPGKPVYPFIWPQYCDWSNEPQELQYIDPTFWKLQLQTIKDAGADGVVIWGELVPGQNTVIANWDGNRPWWTATKEFMSTLSTPSDTTSPTVLMTAPANGATVSGSAVTVSANASDNVGVVGVQFKLDGANLGAEDPSAPYSISWNSTLATNSAHTLTAVARDAAGNTKTSAAVSVSVNNLPPPPAVPDLIVLKAPAPLSIDGSLADWSGAKSVIFSGPSNNATVYALWDSSNLYLAFAVKDSQLNAAETSRDNGNSWMDDNIEVFLDTLNNQGAAMQTDDYHFMVSLNNVQYDSKGTGSGEDAAFNASLRSVVAARGTLNNNADSDTDYIIELAIPLSQLGVTPSNGLILGMDFAVDDKDASAFSYFDYAQIAPNAYAQPNLWKKMQLSSTLSGPAPVPDTPPSVSLTAPANGAAVSGTAVTVSANAADTGGVAGVQFKLDGTNLGTEDLSSPYSVAWNTTTAANGTHTLTAVARDAAGNTGTSAGVSVTVNNPSGDTTPPAISNVEANAGTTSALIPWTTNEPSDSTVAYGLSSANLSLSHSDANLVTSHSISLDGLSKNTTYYYQVTSRDPAGNQSSSGILAFKTLKGSGKNRNLSDLVSR